MTHQAFPIADYQDGLFLAREPFLSPMTAYRDLINGRVFRGRLEKRGGYLEFGALANNPSGKAPDSAPTTTNDIYTGFLINPDTGRFTDLIPQSVVFQWNDAAAGGTLLFGELAGYEQPIDENDNTTITVVAQGTATQIGTYSGQLGQFDIEWSNHPDFTAAGAVSSSMTWRDAVGLPVTGLFTYQLGTSNHLGATDTIHFYEWDSAQGIFITPADSSGLNIFTGATSDDLVWSWPFDSYLLFVNGQDPIYRYTPLGSPVIEPQPVDLDPLNPGTVEIDTAEAVVAWRGRTYVFAPTEAGTRHPRRVRFTVAGSYETYADDGNGWADAPASYGDFVTCQFIGDRLFVGFQNGWMELRRTGDPVAPVEWFPVISRFGAIAKKTTIQDSERLLSRSTTSMQAIDPNGQYPIDEAIPDYAAQWAKDRGTISHAARYEQGREMWWAYVDSGSQEIDAALVAQYDEKNRLSWSKYTVDFTAFVEYARKDSISWSTMPGNWDAATLVTWGDQQVTAGFPSFLGGKLNGRVYELTPATSDDGQPIDFYALSQAISPFPGQRAHLGWIDLYLEDGRSDPGRERQDVPPHSGGSLLDASPILDSLVGNGGGGC
jgi:hypothetical protein